ncbi:GILT-like protein 1 isoform X2 [Anthonomus grandis grandis]|uniref:GILT-like protein 1 isoform X2 n=1 Tax=Anthonomus grandis grandis TaxID=2921223 RepID=UPI0021661366|nr:GILT-like protein 1 isoform X2 [Anthonomus grandis grandis]
MLLKELLYVLICTSISSGALPVTVYYEALCSDSVQFITKQLYPNYRFFKDHLDIEFVPYGKAMHTFNATSGKYKFSCQHGREECLGNQLHACALKQIKDKDTKINFITCVMSAENPSGRYFIEECSKKYNIDFIKLITCGVSDEGSKLLASNGDKTWNLEPNLYYVPTVVFNNSIQINQEDQRNSLSNFKMTMCKKILVESERPEVCNEIGLLERMRSFFSFR